MFDNSKKKKKIFKLVFTRFSHTQNLSTDFCFPEHTAVYTKALMTTDEVFKVLK